MDVVRRARADRVLGTVARVGYGGVRRDATCPARIDPRVRLSRRPIRDSIVTAAARAVAVLVLPFRHCSTSSVRPRARPGDARRSRQRDPIRAGAHVIRRHSRTEDIRDDCGWRSQRCGADGSEAVLGRRRTVHSEPAGRSCRPLTTIRVQSCPGREAPSPMPNVNRTMLVSGGLALAAFLAIGFTLASPARRATPAPPRPEPVPGGDVARLASAPHVLFRHTGLGAHARRLGVASIENPDAPFGVTDLKCDRVAYAAGHGICLHETGGLVSTYEAVLFDSGFRPGATLKLDGNPSRTRI